jgi:X-Pro dipeptidyl-peptidase
MRRSYDARVATAQVFMAAALSVVLASPAAGQAKAAPVFVNGQAQIVPAFQDSTQWIRQELWVETEFDSDGDGKRDRMHVDVTRPAQTASEGLKVAVLYESSPYFAGTSGPRQFLWDVKQEVGAPPPPRTSQPEIRFQPVRPRISNSLVNQWVPRGFAVVHSEAPGTGLSQGCPTVGDAPERLAPKAVIDWLNGRAKGFTSLTGSEEVTASWATGKVGMTGTSYNGTIPLAAATTGVQGLEAIIPVSPNTAYYHYYRSKGLVRHPGGWLGEDIDFLYDYVHSGEPATRAYCNRVVRDSLFGAGRDRISGDYNAFWASRDLLPLVKNIRAATLIAHGFNDWNVVPEHSVRIYEALKATKTPVQAYFHQGGHGGPPPMEMMNRWFSHYLYDVDNGVEKDPRAYVVREGSDAQKPTPYATYPAPGVAPVTLRLTAGGIAVGGLTSANTGSAATETLIDDVQFSGATLAGKDSSNNRLLYATPVLAAPLHISGYPTITIRLAANKPAANLSVWLVTLPFTDDNAGVVTRGWADPQNYKSLTRSGDYHSFTSGEPLVPGKFYDLTFDLQPDDQVIPAGKRLGLMIMSSDRDFTLWPAAGTELTVDLRGTSIVIPVVGGNAALRQAFATP